MKVNTLCFTSFCLVSLTMSCKEKREVNSRGSRETPESITQESDNRLKSSEVPEVTDPKYGKLGGDGFPTDPGLGMNSDKITEEQRMDLRQPVPKNYHIAPPISPKYVTGKADNIDWRNVSDGSFNSPSEDLLAKLLGLTTAQIPPSVRRVSKVLKSPSNGRVIVQSGGGIDRALLFDIKNGMMDVSSEKIIHSVNFDDKRRAFIRWDSFVGESLIIGHLTDDGDIENFPSRQILYTYDIEKMLLRRVSLQKDVQKEEWEAFVIDSVARSEVLIRWDRTQELMTLYLDQ
jgi:hypothetical protein